MKQEQENHDNKNIVPLSNDEIRSILKSQSDSVFEDKNISNNSNFVQKSLIDIALDFKSRQENQEEDVACKTPKNSNNLQDEVDVKLDEEIVQDKNLEEIEEFRVEMDIPKNKTFIMPAGDTRDTLVKMYPLVFELCAKHGYNMTGRDHIIAFNTERGV